MRERKHPKDTEHRQRNKNKALHCISLFGKINPGYTNVLPSWKGWQVQGNPSHPLTWCVQSCLPLELSQYEEIAAALSYGLSRTILYKPSSSGGCSWHSHPVTNWSGHMGQAEVPPHQCPAPEFLGMVTDPGVQKRSSDTNPHSFRTNRVQGTHRTASLWLHIPWFSLCWATGDGTGEQGDP